MPSRDKEARLISMRAQRTAQLLDAMRARINGEPSYAFYVAVADTQPDWSDVYDREGATVRVQCASLAQRFRSAYAGKQPVHEALLDGAHAHRFRLEYRELGPVWEARLERVRAHD